MTLTQPAPVTLEEVLDELNPENDLDFLAVVDNYAYGQRLINGITINNLRDYEVHRETILTAQTLVQEGSHYFHENNLTVKTSQLDVVTEWIKAYEHEMWV